MSVLIFFVAGLLAAVVMRLLMPRSGVGGWIGDVILGLVGSGLGTYLAMSYNMGHALDNFDLLCFMNAFGTAVFLLMLVHWLSRHIPEAPDADMDDLVIT